ncbi:hypothetical protein AJ79_09012 [Helicocarpus griseus UAMH5409]|uniref:Phospholipase D n=1 Tax=Helicocarpus griseus UAMH5409 TaxID=1447875 RepID=A0A2B7WNB8_9EURO|nr:hypothetical protein AJ79_09012 [Helicocarpus griseus UAMH5409]
MLSLSRSLPLLCSAYLLLINIFLSISLVQAAPALVEKRNAAKHVYAIAHKVLTVEALEDAINDGANAIEVDLTAWKKGDKTGTKKSKWMMDHDGDGKNHGDTAEKVFKAVEKLVEDKRTVAFFEFDIKNPDHCEADEDCGIDALRKMARKYLQPHGVRTLYRFQSKHTKTEDFKRISADLNDDEAVTVSTATDGVLKAYKDAGKEVPKEKRIMDYGFTGLDKETGFGTCKEKKSKKLCTQIVQAVKARDDGKLAKVIAWTATSADTKRVLKLLDKGLDGIVYGPGHKEYKSSKDTKAMLKAIKKWIHEHSDSHVFGGQRDAPWG